MPSLLLKPRLIFITGVAQMKEALTSVRAVLGNDIPGLTDKEIQSHLWYYYFDVAQTVSYILSEINLEPLHLRNLDTKLVDRNIRSALTKGYKYKEETKGEDQ